MIGHFARGKILDLYVDPNSCIKYNPEIHYF
jgi:hypothetical protein